MSDPFNFNDLASGAANPEVTVNDNFGSVKEKFDSVDNEIEALEARPLGISDAPSDGKAYNRKDGAWSADLGGGGISEAPEDGKQYGRQNKAWTEISVSSGGGSSSGSTARNRGNYSASTDYKSVNFETRALPTGFTVEGTGGTVPVFRDIPDTAIGTTVVFEFPDINHSGQASLIFKVIADASKNKVSFRYRGSSEKTFDRLTISINGTVQTTKYDSNDDAGFVAVEFAVPTGESTVGINFVKDNTGNVGYDNFRISQITYPTGGVSYVFGDVVKFNSKYFFCLVSGTTATPTTVDHWVQFGA